MSHDYQGWIIAAIVALVGAMYFWFRDPTPVQEVSHIEQAPVQKEVVRTRVSATMMNCTRQGETIEMRGEVQNTGTTRVSRVVLETLWKDDFGLVIERGTVLAIGEDSPLAPGARRSFTDTSSNLRVKRCNVEVIDYWADEPRP
jgi:hypothetical protein